MSASPSPDPRHAVRAWLLTIVLASLAAGPASARTEGEGQADTIKAMQADPVEAGRKALSHATPDALARSAFGFFVEGSPSLRTGDAMKVLLGFSAREGMFTTACGHLALSAQRDGVVHALAADGRPEAHRLAAGTLLFAALADYLGEASDAAFDAWVKERKAESPPAEEDDSGGGRRKGKLKGGRKGARTAAAQTPVTVPAALVKSPSVAAAFLAIRAAAYAHDESVAAAIESCTTNEPRIAGARLLYAARLERPLPAELLAAAFAPPPRRVGLPVVQGVRGPKEPESNVPDVLDVPGLCPAVEALGLRPDPAHLPLLLGAAAHEDARVRLEAARALRRFDGDEVKAFMGRWLQTCDWPVVVELADALGEKPDPRSVPALIGRLRHEQGRMRMDLVRALSSIAGSQVAQSADAWAAWWKTNAATFVVDAAASAAYRKRTPVQNVDLIALGFFYSLPIQSDRICYVVDASNSMKGDRIESLRRNLRESVDGLGDPVRYGIVHFGGDLVVLESDGLLQDRRKGSRHAQEMPLSGGTRAYDAMERAARIPGVDTLLFLSDGAPVRSRYNAWADILRVLGVVHRYLPLSIHAVNFDPRPANGLAMRKLAACNAGVNADIDAGAGADEF